MTLTVAQARVLVGLQATDDSADARLQQLVDAAYEQAAHFVGPLSRTTVTETARNRRGQLALKRRPVTGLTSVTGVADVSALTVVSARSGLVEGLPESVLDRTDVTVVYSCGYATVPASVEEGVRAWVRHRGLQESFGSDTYGDSAADITDFKDLPNAVRNAWKPFLIVGRGGMA